MKKLLIGIGIFFGIAVCAQLIGVSFAAPYPVGLGGTGTSQTPANGAVPIGNGAGSYTPAVITPGTDIIITNASGSVTLAVRTSDFLPSSTVYVATVNGQSGAVTITSSTLGTATNTISLFNGNGFTTTTIQSVLNSLSATGLLTYNSSTGAFGYTSSSLALGSASHNSFSDFLPSSTVYVATVNGQSGAVTIGIPATTTINGTQSSTFRLIGDGTTITSTVSGATTTFSIINTGNWAGTWQGVNSSTFYLASNPSGYITTSTNNFGGITNASVTALSPVIWSTTSTISCPTCIATNTGNWAGTWQGVSSSTFYLASNPNGYITSAGATSTINGVVGPNFTFSIVGTSSVSSITTSSANIFLNLLRYSSSSNITITSTGTIVFATTSVSQFANDAGYLSTNTGNWAGTWQGVNSSTFVTSAVTSLTGTSGQVNVSAATGTVTISTPQNINTTSSPTFAGVTVNGNVTGTILNITSSTASFIPNLLDTYYFPSPTKLAAGATCGTVTGVTEVGNCANDILAAGPANGVRILFGPYTYSSSTYTNSIVCGTNLQRCILEGVPGATTLNYGGGAGTNFIRINTNNIGNAQQSGSEVIGLVLADQTGQNATTTNPTVGIQFNGANGAIHALVDRATIRNAGYCLEYGANAYDVVVQNTTLSGCGQLGHWDTPSNSGEGDTWINVFANNPTTNNASNTVSANQCMYFDSNAIASFRMFGGSKDNCGVTALSGNLSLSFIGVHDENASYATYGPYARYTIATSTGTGLLISGGQLMNDATSTNTPAAPIINSAFLDIEGLTIDQNSTGQWTNLVNESASGTIVINGINPVGSPYAGMVNGSPAGATSYQQIGTGNPVTIGNFTGGQVGIGTNNPQGVLDVGGFWPLTQPFNSGNNLGTFSGNANSAVGIVVANTSTQGSADSRILTQDTTQHWYGFLQASVNATNTLLGLNRSSTDYLTNNAGTARDIAVGTIAARSFNIGTGNALRLQISSSGFVGINTGANTASTSLQVIDPTNNSSTIRIGASGKNSCLEMPSASGTVGTLIYIFTDSNAVLYATSTKPAYCQ